MTSLVLQTLTALLDGDQVFLARIDAGLERLEPVGVPTTTAVYEQGARPPGVIKVVTHLPHVTGTSVDRQQANFYAYTGTHTTNTD